jgi:hypothetical protein
MSNPDLFTVVIIKLSTGDPRLLGPYDSELDVHHAVSDLTDSAVLSGKDEYYYPAVVRDVSL